MIPAPKALQQENKARDQSGAQKKRWWCTGEHQMILGNRAASKWRA